MDSAVLGTHFLTETLGLLGRIGCAMCLVGSVVIVLHAPADKDIEDINVMLHYAVQPGILRPLSCMSVLILIPYRISFLLPGRHNLRRSYDLHSCAHLRAEKSSHISIHMLGRRIHFSHGH